MTLALVLGIACACGLSLGLVMVSGSFTPTRSLSKRLAPWVADVSEPAARLVVARAGSTSMALARLGTRLSSWFGSTTTTQTWLRQAGASGSQHTWSIRLAEFALGGAVVGLTLGLLGSVAGLTTWLACGAFVVVGMCSAIVLRRYLLKRAAHKRVAAMLEELPTLLDLLSLALTAGETFRDGLRRVCAHGNGPLADEFRAVQHDVETGIPLAQAMANMTQQLGVMPLSRSIDHVINGLDRGTPLAQVLRTQAAEARSEALRRVHEQAATREVAMLVPLIFVILPVTIGFAIFPGLLVIQAGL